jgi:hypothetical protein
MKLKFVKKIYYYIILNFYKSENYFINTKNTHNYTIHINFQINDTPLYHCKINICLALLRISTIENL